MDPKENENMTTEDLEKSLAKLEEAATVNDEPSRKEALLEKAKTGDLEKSEAAELFQLIGVKPEAPPSETGDALVKGFNDNEPLQKALDVSDFLKEQHDELCKSLRAVGDRMEETDQRRHEFNLVMAKAVHDIGTLVKSMAETFDGFMSQPAAAPKSRGIRTGKTQVMQKSFANPDEPQEPQLRKGEVLSTLLNMHEESIQKGMKGKAVNGEDLALATSKYEQTNRISPALLGEVKQRLNGGN